MSLRDTQMLFWRAISWPTGIADFLAQADADTVRAFEETFAATPSFPRTERMEVYAEAYYWRLHGVLEEHFPLVSWLAGEARFRNLVTDYVLGAPSVDPDVRQLGARFPESIKRHPIASEIPALTDVATIQWSIVDVLDEIDEPTVDESVLRSIPADRWPDLRFRASSATRLHPTRYDYRNMAAARKRGEPPDPSDLEPHDPPSYVVVYRSAHEVFHRTVDPPQGRALQAMLRGNTFAEICAIAAGTAGADATPDDVVAWLRGWLASSMIASVSARP